MRYQDGDLAFPSPDGVHRAGFERLRFHDLRHGHATHLLVHGIHPKVVSERLGHSTIGITLDTYSHVIPGLQEEAARRRTMHSGQHSESCNEAAVSTYKPQSRQL